MTYGKENIDNVLKDTDIFNDFIKGITWFHNEKVFNLKEPAYHRHGSCQERGKMNDNCKERAENIEKCYFERLIYNEL